MIIELECIAVGESRCFSESDTTAAFSALAVAIFDGHDLVRKVALVHIKVEAVHGNQFDECNVVRLLLRVGDVVSEHKASTLAGVSVEIKKHLQAFVLLSLLHNCFASSPDCWVVGF